MRGNLILLLIYLGVVNSEITYIDIGQYDDFIVPDLKAACLNYNISDIVSKSCGEQLDLVCQNVSLLSTMVDASSKFPYTGLGYATRMDYGNFDQCMTVDHEYEGGRILGEHCTVGLVIPDLLGNISDSSLYYMLAVCRPNGCTASDLNALTANITNLTLPLFQDGYCQTMYTDSEYTAADIVAISIISVCSLLMVISTTYHFYLHKKQLECPNLIFLAFSVLYNGKKLLKISKQSKDQIDTFQGLRVISMMWIIAGHGLAVWATLSVTNATEVAEWQTKISSVYITAAPLAVDTFFFISGFLLAYQYLKQKPKPLVDHVKTVPSMYLHRYLRLTPAVAMLYLVALSLMRHFGSGPLWSVANNYLSAPCRKYWWSFFLYIQNYYNYNDQDICLIVTWYLSADMQMFLLSPLVIIPVAVYLQKSKGFKLSMIQMFILNLIFIALPLATKLLFQDYTNNYDTHSRLIDYFVGAMLGIFMRVKQDKPFLYMVNSTRKSIICSLVWILVLPGMYAIFLCHREVELHHGYVSKSIFSSLMRPGWCIGLSWIVYACHHGYGGLINWILCRPIFQIWGRLTYCMYLVHLLVIIIYAGTVRTRSYFTDYNGFYVFCGHLVVTLVLSMFWTLAFESPLITIEKVVLGGGKRISEVKSTGTCCGEKEIKRNSIRKINEMIT